MLATQYRQDVAAYLLADVDIRDCLHTCVCYSRNKDDAAQWAIAALTSAGVTHTDRGKRITKTTIRFAMQSLR